MLRPILLLVLLAAAALPGCNSIRPREIVVGLDPAAASAPSHPTIEVDLVGLDDAERKAWDEMSLSSYWMPGSQRRAAVADRAIRIRFGSERTDPVRIPVDSGIWSAWKKSGATWLYVVANLPGGLEDKRGADDPRRLAVSLTTDEWAEDAALLIEIRRDAVVFLTPRAENAPARGN